MTSSNNNNSSSYENNKEKFYSKNNVSNKRDPYSVLNQSRNASTVDIQRAYKRGSRALHPDKQQASLGVQRNHDESDNIIVLSDIDAREAFVVLKDSYDILSDPCLRQAYDTYGYYGVEFVRLSLSQRPGSNNNTTDTERGSSVPGSSLYHTLSSLHSQGKDQEALRALKDAVEFHQYQRYMQKYPTHASIEIYCSTIDDDKSRYYSIEPRKVAMGFESVILSSTSTRLQQQQQSTATENNIVHDNRWSVILASNMTQKNGECSSRSAVRLECYEVQPNTDIAVEVSSSDNEKPNHTLALTSTRVLASGTTVKVGGQTETNRTDGKYPLALSLSTHRLLWDNSVSGAVSLGMGLPDRSLHYISCSFTTLGAWPLLRGLRLSASCNLGVGRYPLKVSVRKANGNDNNRSLSVGLDPVAGKWELKMTSIRAVSKYVNFGIGISDVSKGGLSLMLFLQRGDNMTFKVPISIVRNNSNSYYYSLMPISFKVARIGFISFLLDVATASIIQTTTSTATINLFTKYNFLQSTKKKRENHIETTTSQFHNGKQKTFLLFQTASKGRKESELQLQLMAKTAEKKKWIEASKNGLVITLATYYTQGTSQSLDVTSQLQFWVTDSKLFLPGGSSKAKIIGFYDLMSKDDDKDSFTVKLYVRYQIGSYLYEITVNDMDGLILPNEHAVQIRGCKIAQ